MADLHARLVAALRARLEVARAASQDRDSSTPAGEHWRWECSSCDTVVEITPVTILDEFLECPSCRSVGLALRSVEQYRTRSVGDLPHFVLNSVEELRPVDAAYLLAHDPATEIRRVEALLRVVQRHASECVRCVEWGTCPDVRDHAEGEGIEP